MSCDKEKVPFNIGRLICEFSVNGIRLTEQ